MFNLLTSYNQLGCDLPSLSNDENNFWRCQLFGYFVLAVHTDGIGEVQEMTYFNNITAAGIVFSILCCHIFVILKNCYRYICLR